MLADKLSGFEDNKSNVFAVKVKTYNECLADTLDNFAPVQNKMVDLDQENPPKWIDSEKTSSEEIKKKTKKKQKKTVEAAWY